MRRRIAALVAGLWAGNLVCIALIAAPAAFSVLTQPDAGRFVNRLFEREAYVSIAAAVTLCVFERMSFRDVRAASVFSATMLLCLGALFCTVAGYFAVQPLMDAARAGRGSISFGSLHVISAGFFVVKSFLALTLAWRLRL